MSKSSRRNLFIDRKMDLLTHTDTKELFHTTESRILYRSCSNSFASNLIVLASRIILRRDALYA